jgi:hypothetical protein
MIRYTMRIPDDLYAQVKEVASRDERSVHAEILWLVRRGLASTDGGPPSGGSPAPAPLRGKPDSPPA